MLDDKGRIFGKISLVDLFALVVLAAVVFAVFQAAGRRPALEAERYIYISFFAPAMHDFAAQALLLDTRVMDDDGGTFLGSITDIEITESINFAPNRLGELVASPMYGHNFVTFTSRVHGRMAAAAAQLDGRLYAVGDEVHLWAGGVRAIVHISQIEGGSE
jgi:hypothetical protein